jgi:AsmA protein
MKRAALWTSIAVAAVVFVVLTLPHFLASDLIKKRIVENIAALTGREVHLSGTPVLSIYPSLAITVSGLTIANPQGVSGEPFLTSDSVTARVRLLPLLLGNPDIDSVELTKPRIYLVESSDGRSNWTFAGVGSPADALPRNLKVTAGTIVYDNAAASQHQELTDIDLSASWPSGKAALSGNGDLTWRGEPVTFTAQLDDPLAVLSGVGAPLVFALAAQPIRVSFAGTLGRALDGTISVSSPALRRALNWAGVAMGNGSTLGAAGLKGKLDWAGQEIAMANAAVDLDGNSANGAFTFDFGGPRPRLEATLAAASIDLSPYLDAFRQPDTAAVPAPGVSHQMTFPIDADVGLSADQLTLAILSLDAVAGEVRIDSGSVAVTISRANAYGGALTGSAILTRFGDSYSSRGEVKLSSVSARSALSDLAAIRSLDASADLDMVIATDGASLGEMVQRLTGQCRFTLADGTLSGISVSDLTGLAAGPSLPLSPGAGSLSFARITGTASLGAGVVQSGDLAVVGGGYRIDAKGDGSIASGTIEGKATVAAGAGERTTIVPVAISGTWTQPLFQLDRTPLPASVVSPKG